MNKGHSKNCFECMKERRIVHVIISQDYLPIFTEYFLLSADQKQLKHDHQKVIKWSYKFTLTHIERKNKTT